MARDESSSSDDNMDFEPIKPQLTYGPRPNLRESFEVTAKGSFSWLIPSWKHITKSSQSEEDAMAPVKLYSEEFEVGEKKWRVLLFPNGNNCEYVSVYLDYSDKHSKPGWSTCARFSISFVNPYDETLFVTQTANHRFNERESDWGFTHFAKPIALLTQLPPATRPIIENDSCKIKVEIEIIKDESGHLWQNYMNYDSKEETGFVGLKNQGATCYMNSLLQALFLTNYLKKAVFQIPTESDDPSNSVALALQRVFYQLQFSDKPVGTTELTKSFGWDTLDSFMQHDVQEFNRVLQDTLESKMKNTKAEGAIQKLFVGEMKSFVKCVNVEYESSRIESFYDIQLNVKGKQNLYESFKDYIQVEMLDGENKYHADGFGLQDAKKGVIFKKFPPILHLQLKRFEYDMMKDSMVKINDRHEFPLTIELDEFLEEKPSTPQVYHLYGVLVHAGDVHGGHYCAFLRKPARLDQEPKWMKFDDDRVTNVTEKEAMEDNFGGELEGQNTRSLKYKRFTNAYMLIYYRESDLAEILSEVTDNDIPKHLVERIEEEKKLEIARRQERQQQFMSMNVRLVTTQDAREHVGYDICNFDDKNFPVTEGTVIRVLKDATVAELRKEISNALKIPSYAFRIWNMVLRKNRTTRPENSLLLQQEDARIKDFISTGTREVRLFIETCDNPVSEKLEDNFPPVDENSAMIFIKFYNPAQCSLSTLGVIFFSRDDSLTLLRNKIIEVMNFDPSTEISMYEEIKPTYILPMKMEMTLRENELEFGDIVCFQVKLKDDENYEYPTIPSFFDFISNRIVVSFKEAEENEDWENRDAKKIKEDDSTFSLVLSKKMDYDTVAAKVGEKLNVDPTKLRFFSVDGVTGGPKTPIKRFPELNLSNMLQMNYYYNNSADGLYYQILSVSLTEMENKKTIKLKILEPKDEHNSEVSLVLELDSTVDDIQKGISNLVRYDSHEGSGKIRILEVVNHRISREFIGQDTISSMNSLATLYVEEIPKKELNLNENAKVINCFSFYKNVSHTHGIPFKLIIPKDTKLSDLKEEIQKKLKIGEKEFSKCKFALTHYTRADYLDEDKVLFDTELNPVYHLGIDRVDKDSQAIRYGFEKAIKIKN